MSNIMITFRSMMTEPDWKELGKGCSVRPTFNRAIAMLRTELRYIGATDVIVEAGFPREQIRNDGWPYSSAKPVHSTVRISFRRGGTTPMSLTCGGHATWYFNVYLIAMTLSRLRAVKRYGCITAAQLYRGVEALPPPSTGAEGRDAAGTAPICASVEEGMRYLSHMADCDIHSLLPEDCERLYKIAARKHHPDAGGDAGVMSRINRVRDFIQAQMRTGGAA